MTVLFSKFLESCTWNPTWDLAKERNELNPICAGDLSVTETFQCLLSPLDELVMHTGDGHAIRDLHDDSGKGSKKGYQEGTESKRVQLYIQTNFVDRTGRVLQHPTNIATSILNLDGVVLGDHGGGKVLVELFAVLPPLRVVAQKSEVPIPVHSTKYDRRSTECGGHDRITETTHNLSITVS